MKGQIEEQHGNDINAVREAYKNGVSFHQIVLTCNRSASNLRDVSYALMKNGSLSTCWFAVVYFLQLTFMRKLFCIKVDFHILFRLEFT